MPASARSRRQEPRQGMRSPSAVLLHARSPARPRRSRPHSPAPSAPEVSQGDAREPGSRRAASLFSNAARGPCTAPAPVGLTGQKQGLALGLCSRKQPPAPQRCHCLSVLLQLTNKRVDRQRERMCGTARPLSRPLRSGAPTCACCERTGEPASTPCVHTTSWRRWSRMFSPVPPARWCRRLVTHTVEMRRSPPERVQGRA